MVIKELKVSEGILVKWVLEDLQDIQDLKVMMEYRESSVNQEKMVNRSGVVQDQRVQRVGLAVQEIGEPKDHRAQQVSLELDVTLVQWVIQVGLDLLVCQGFQVHKVHVE